MSLETRTVYFRPSPPLLFSVLVILAVALPICSSVVLSHQGGFGYWLVEIGEDSVQSVVSISLLDLNFVSEIDSNGDGLVDYQEVLRNRQPIEQRILEHFQVEDGGRRGSVNVTDFEILESGELVLKFEHRFSEQLGSLELLSTFPALTDFEHRVFCKVEVGGVTEQLVFDRYTRRHQVGISRVWSGTLERIAHFVGLGVEHIFTGYDHLAFLLGLILLGGSVRQLIGVVSSFTVAHSITLTLATLDVIVLPTQFVESAIALSICYIAMENIFVREVKGRWKITFFFGLIHGFGFSNILREMQLPRSGLAASLFSFNLGVEIGQVVVIALLCPILFFAAKQTWHKSAVTVTSALIGCLGLVWFVDRMS